MTRLQRDMSRTLVLTTVLLLSVGGVAGHAFNARNCEPAVTASQETAGTVTFTGVEFVDATGHLSLENIWRYGLSTLRLNVECDGAPFTSGSTTEEATSRLRSNLIADVMSKILDFLGVEVQLPTSIDVSPFGETVVASDGDCMVSCARIHTTWATITLLVIGFVLIRFSQHLSHRAWFYYTFGIATGTVTLVLMAMIVLYRIIRKVNNSLASMFTGAATMGALVGAHTLTNNARSHVNGIWGILEPWFAYIVAYVVMSVLLVGSILYIKGPVQNERVFRVTDIAIKIIGSLCLFLSVPTWQVGLGLAAFMPVLYAARLTVRAILYVVCCRCWRRRGAALSQADSDSDDADSDLASDSESFTRAVEATAVAAATVRRRNLSAQSTSSRRSSGSRRSGEVDSSHPFFKSPPSPAQPRRSSHREGNRGVGRVAGRGTRETAPLPVSVRRQIIAATRTGMNDLRAAIRENFQIFDREKTFADGLMDHLYDFATLGVVDLPDERPAANVGDSFVIGPDGSRVDDLDITEEELERSMQQLEEEDNEEEERAWLAQRRRRESMADVDDDASQGNMNVRSLYRPRRKSLAGE